MNPSILRGQIPITPRVENTPHFYGTPSGEGISGGAPRFTVASHGVETPTSTPPSLPPLPSFLNESGSTRRDHQAGHSEAAELQQYSLLTVALRSVRQVDGDVFIDHLEMAYAVQE